MELSKDSWRARQMQDPDLCLLRNWLREGELPTKKLRRNFSPVLCRLLQEAMVRCIEEPDTQTQADQLLVPKAYTRGLWKDYHQMTGHSSAEKVLSVLRRRFFWAGMGKEVKVWTRGCTICAASKLGREPHAPLKSIKTSYPFEVVGLDYLTLGRPTDQYPYVLVITDLFSRYALAIPTTCFHTTRH